MRQAGLGLQPVVEPMADVGEQDSPRAVLGSHRSNFCDGLATRRLALL